MFKHRIPCVFMTTYPTRDRITMGNTVLVETKENQGTRKSTKGIVDSILTWSRSYLYGIKVRLHDRTIGRIKEILTETQEKSPEYIDNLKSTEESYISKTNFIRM